MEDMERYGDYTEYEDDQPKKKGAFLSVLKIVTAVVCIAVLGVLLFRIVISGYYPNDMKRLYFNDTLTAYYEANGGEIGAKSLKVKAPYDDEKDGIFFAENLIIIDGADQIQFTVRINKHVYKELSEKYGFDVTSEMIKFSLAKSYSGDEVNIVTMPNVKVEKAKTDSFFMYECFKVVCDGVDWEFESDKTEWLVLEIYIDGVDHLMTDANGELKNPPYRILLYRNMDDYIRLKDYDLSRKEHP